MDVTSLLKDSPDLISALTEGGLPTDKVDDLGASIGNQLAGGGLGDLTELLGGLDLDSFLGKIDIGALAQDVGISPEIAQMAVSLIGPKVAEFVPGGMDTVTSLASKLFD